MVRVGEDGRCEGYVCAEWLERQRSDFCLVCGGYGQVRNMFQAIEPFMPCGSPILNHGHPRRPNAPTIVSNASIVAVVPVKVEFFCSNPSCSVLYTTNGSVPAIGQSFTYSGMPVVLTRQGRYKFVASAFAPGFSRLSDVQMMASECNYSIPDRSCSHDCSLHRLCFCINRSPRMGCDATRV